MAVAIYPQPQSKPPQQSLDFACQVFTEKEDSHWQPLQASSYYHQAHQQPLQDTLDLACQVSTVIITHDH